MTTSSKLTTINKPLAETATINHLSGAHVVYGKSPDDIANIKAGEPVTFEHPTEFEALALDGSTKTVKPTDSFGKIVPTTPEAAAAIRKEFREGTFNLYVDKDSSVEFGSKHVPSGTVTNGSHLTVDKGASVQHIQMDNSDFHWTKGVVRDCIFTNSSMGENELATGSGFLTRITANNSQIGMANNHASNMTLDHVVAGGLTGRDSDLAASKATKSFSDMPTMVRSGFINTHVKTGLGSNIIDSTLTNSKIDSKLAEDLDSSTLNSVNLNHVNLDVKSKEGSSLSGTKLADVIATTPVTASKATITGRPWHPLVVNTPLDVTNANIETLKGAVVYDKDNKFVSFGSESGKAMKLSDKEMNHNLEWVLPNHNGAEFKQLGSEDHGIYPDATEKQVKLAITEAQTTLGKLAAKTNAKAAKTTAKAATKTTTKTATKAAKTATKAAAKAPKTTAKKAVEKDEPEL